MLPPLVRLCRIERTFGETGTTVSALRSIDLEIEAGSFVSIVGPSGSGKSTLLGILGLLDNPSSGRYFLNEVEMTGLTSEELARCRNRSIGFVFQAYNLLPNLTARENVELSLAYRGITGAERHARAASALEQVGLSSRTGHLPSRLSGGEQQRVAVARGIVGDPEILLVDEPTGALDQATGEEVLEIFRNLNRAGRTIVMVTHDRDIANRAERIIHLLDGRIERDETHKCTPDAAT